MSDRFLSRWSRLKRENDKRSKSNDGIRQNCTPSDILESAHQADSSPAIFDPPKQSLLDQVVDSEPLDDVLPTEANLNDVFNNGGIQKFLNPKVDPNLRNKAFKTLFQLPELGVIDYLDVYMEDFNVYDKLDDVEINKMESAKALLSRVDLLSDPSLTHSEEPVADEVPEISPSVGHTQTSSPTTDESDSTQKPD
ncbi:DUF3306 domain-containing protein [Limnobacter sp.]|uniref:DUF3306 domain-containing protein n=1 Tax=Limnobacter sp. TaxID=2003368 RepID=UPI00258D5881|nr:DUF3306 domain-containing protein [Limnobacter sp.]